MLSKIRGKLCDHDISRRLCARTWVMIFCIRIIGEMYKNLIMFCANSSKMIEFEFGVFPLSEPLDSGSL